MARATVQPSGYTILVVDDQVETLRSTKRLLEREGHRVLVASDGRAALDLFERETLHLLIIDYFMPAMTGEELIAEIRRRDDRVQILLQTGYAGEKPAREMLELLDIQGYHDKGDGAERLLLWVGVCLKAHRQLERVREAEGVKSELLANLSHEFRTPINISLGYVGMLLEGACGTLTPDAQELLGRVRCNSTSLLTLVNDLLDLSKLEVQAAELRLEPLALDGLRDEVRRILHGLRGGEKPSGLRWDVPAGLPPVQADRAKLRLMLTQLFSHAVAAASDDEIRVSAELVGPSQVALCFRYPGDDAALAAPVDGAVGPEAGVANGLLVARRLARAIGADLSVGREPGSGWTVRLALAAVAEPSRAEARLAGAE